MERFDESLILLKRFLCWSIKDILYIPRNVRRKSGTKIQLQQADIERLRIWNFADFMLYDVFKKRFEAQIAKEGPSLESEVQYLKATNTLVTEFCMNQSDNRNANGILNIPQSVWSDGFYVNKTDCSYMLMDELDMMQRAIRYGQQRLNRTVNVG